MRPARVVPVLLAALALARPALAQEDQVVVQEDQVVVPPPPTEATPPPAAPSAPLVNGVPLDFVVTPLLVAAEADLAAGRFALALARTTVVAEALPEGLPLRVRADGLRVLATQRMPEGTAPPPPDEVHSPMIAQADLDLRAGQPQLALPRLDFVLGRLPAGSPLASRAAQLRAYAASMLGAPPPPMPAPPPMLPTQPAPQTPEVAGGHRGTGEIVELYISAAAAGAITGAYIPFLASNETATTTTYTLTTLAGAGLFAVGVLTLDLTTQLPSGVPPTISSSIRFGIAHGMLSMGIYFATPSATHDGDVAFSLAWGGSIAGALVGLGVGFGLTPSVQEARWVESTGWWGAALGTYVAMLTEYRDASAGLGLTLGGLDIGLLTGMVMTALGAVPSTRRTLWLDLGFFAGSGVGALIPSLYFAIEEEPVLWPAYGVGMLLGSLTGWALAYLLSDGFDAPESSAQQQPTVHLGIGPVEGGAALTVDGAF